MKTEIQIDGQSIAVEIKAMKRKSMRLTVTEHGTVDVRVPMRCPRKDLEAFLLQHSGWIKERLAAVLAQREKKQAEFHYLGRLYLVVADSTVKALTLQGHESGEGECRIPASWSQEEFLANSEQWLRKKARDYFQSRIDFWWPRFADGAHIGFPTLRVKKMRTRWGSLSSRGYINLNMKLMYLPQHLIEMVVVHELCHSHHLHHGRAFYQLMATHMPDYRAREIELRQIEQGLMY
jgi:predicted metal-dependent hydrolase